MGLRPTLAHPFPALQPTLAVAATARVARTPPYLVGMAITLALVHGTVIFSAAIQGAAPAGHGAHAHWAAVVAPVLAANAVGVAVCLAVSLLGERAEGVDHGVGRGSGRAARSRARRGARRPCPC